MTKLFICFNVLQMAQLLLKLSFSSLLFGQNKLANTRRYKYSVIIATSLCHSAEVNRRQSRNTLVQTPISTPIFLCNFYRVLESFEIYQNYLRFVSFSVKQGGKIEIGDFLWFAKEICSFNFYHQTPRQWFKSIRPQKYSHFAGIPSDMWKIFPMDLECHLNSSK